MKNFTRDTTGKKGGARMSDREHTAKSTTRSVTDRTGVTAPLSRLRRARGSGAPSARRLRAALAFALAIAAFAISAAPASAAIEMGSVSEVSYASAKATAKVLTNSRSGFGASYTFELSTDNGTTWNPGPSVFVGNVVPKPAQIEGELKDLKSGTHYLVRVSGDGSTSPAAPPYPSFTTLTADPTEVVSIDNASELSYTTAKATGKVKRPEKSDDVACHFEYITDQQFTENLGNSAPGFQGANSAGCEPESVSTVGNEVPVEAKLKELAPATTYHLRLVAKNAANSDAKEAPNFTTLTVDPPSVKSIEDAAGVEYTQASVEGVVERPATSEDPAFDIAPCNFEYVTDTQFGESGFAGAPQVECQTEPPENPIHASGETTVKAHLGGLVPQTTYHLRLSATNLGGTDSEEAADTFTTEGPVPPPTIVSVDDASNVTIHGAHLSGVIQRPAGSADPAFDTSCRFEYVTDQQFGETGFEGAPQALCNEAPFYAPLTTTDPTTVTADLTGLKAGTAFHLRLAAENGGGTVTEDAATFTTLEAEKPTVSIDPVASGTFTTAHVSGTIGEGQGSGLITGFFEISSDGGATWSHASNPDAQGVGVQQHDYTGLQPATTYLFRISAWHDHAEGLQAPFELGEVAFSATESITTEPLDPPTVTFDPVTNITANSAHFSGSVDTNAPAGPLSPAAKAAYKTDWHFECTPECPQQPGLSGTVTAEEGSAAISTDVKHLDANTHYVVKLIAKNALETPGEAERTFDTSFVTPTVTALPGGSDGEGGYTLAGIVNPNGSDITACEFKWGPNSAGYAFSAPCSPMPESRDEVQKIKIIGPFRLSYHGQTTGEIPADVPATAVEAELQALPSIGPANVVVSRTVESTGAGSVNFYTVTFGGALGDTNVDLIGVAGNGTVTTVRSGGDNQPQTVEAHLTGLNPGAVYHFRLLATNGAGTGESNPDLEFTPTLAVKASCPNEQLRAENNSLALPECRAYEMVTDPNKEGNPAVLADFDGGAAVAYESNATNIAGSGQGLFGGNQYVATPTANGWETIPDLNGPTGSLSGPPEGVEPLNSDTIGVIHSADLLSSIWSLRKKGSPTGIYLRRPGGGFELVGAGTLHDTGGPRLAVFASDDLSHVVLSELPGSPYSPEYGPGVYEFVGTGNDQPRRVDVDNTEAPICGGISHGNAISGDGRVIVVSPACGSVWARVDGTTSYDISASQCNRAAPADPCNAPADATFQAAAKDGSRVYFTTTQQLVNGDTDETNDLYACDIPPGTPAPTAAPANPCSALHEVSAGTAGKADVQQVLAVSDDGSTAYFTARGVLAANQDALGEAALAGDENLYIWRTDAAHPAGQIAFVARLPEGGTPVAETTPDGSYLVLQTAGQLVSSDTDESTDIYRYDAVSGGLVRVSTAVSGAGGNGEFDASIARSVPAGSAAPNFPHDSHPAISDDGKLIVFATEEPLSPLDGNGEADAYLWNDGHALGTVAPLLPGIFAGFGDVPGQAVIDGSGQDLYIQTAARLTPTDVDTTTDVYDARVDGGFPQHQEGCAGETCQPSASNPPASTPASPANHSNGEGNAKPKTCPKGKVLKGKKCVKKHQKKHKSKHHKNKSHHKHHGKKSGHKQGGGK